MSDDPWLMFSERVRAEGAWRASCEPLARLPDDAALAQQAERNLSTLASIAAIEERPVDSADDDNPVMQELARLDAKLNALVDILNRQLAPAGALPARQRLQFNASGALLPPGLAPAGDAAVLRMHFDACPSLPLELPGRLARRFDDGSAFLAFALAGDLLAGALERQVFRLHRRRVAETRQSST